MANLVGQTIANRYHVQEFLGRGGMAEVYKVWDKEMAVFLAMKLLHDDLADDSVFIRRFRREADTLAKLQHPNIVRHYGLREEDLNIFMLMEFVEGHTLRREIRLFRDKNMPSEKIKEIMRPICSALHFAHNSGYIHADIKPANVMIDGSGRVYLADFGIARMADAATATMVGAGTPAYMAPEMIKGLEPVSQSDIYSLGIVLYEMLTGGERPFIGETAKISGSLGEKVRWEQINLDPPSPCQWNAKISSEMEKVVMKCLAKSPKDRYQNAVELLNAIELATGEELEVHDQNEKNIEIEGIEEKETKKEIIKNNINLDNRWFVIAGIVLIMVLFSLIGFSNGGVFVNKNNENNYTFETDAPPKTSTESKVVLSFLDKAIEPITTPTITLEPSATTTNIPTFTPAPLFTATPEIGIGSTWTRPADGMNMVYVPAGEFTMGSDTEKTEEKPAHIIFLDNYWIDKTEVTNEMHKKCVSAGYCSPQFNGTSISRGDYYNNSLYSEYPVIFVSWNDAKTYCSWTGGGLPTESEWEKAARGIDERIYPWGDKFPDNNLANFGNNLGDTNKTGMYPNGASTYLALDMAGNVSEWVNANYQIYPGGSPSGQNIFNKSYIGVRGGGWYNPGINLRSAERYFLPENTVYNSIGFRCAMSSAEQEAIEND